MEDDLSETLGAVKLIETEEIEQDQKNPLKIPPEREIKEKRIQFVVTPTLYKKLQLAKKRNKMSINEIITQFVELHIDDVI